MVVLCGGVQCEGGAGVLGPLLPSLYSLSTSVGAGSGLFLGNKGRIRLVVVPNLVFMAKGNGALPQHLIWVLLATELRL